MRDMNNNNNNKNDKRYELQKTIRDKKKQKEI